MGHYPHTPKKKKKNRPIWNAIVRIKKRNIINERKFGGEGKARKIFSQNFSIGPILKKINL